MNVHRGMPPPAYFKKNKYPGLSGFIRVKPGFHPLILDSDPLIFISVPHSALVTPHSDGPAYLHLRQALSWNIRYYPVQSCNSRYSFQEKDTIVPLDTALHTAFSRLGPALSPPKGLPASSLSRGRRAHPPQHPMPWSAAVIPVSICVSSVWIRGTSLRLRISAPSR